MWTAVILILFELLIDEAVTQVDLCRGKNPGYHPYPGDCTKFVQCWKGGDRMMTGVSHCPFGLFWDTEYLTCRPSLLVNCQADPCLTGRQGSTFAMPDYGCRAFWQCKGGRSVGRCCTIGSLYVQTFGCLSNSSCLESCPPEEYIATEPPCVKRSYSDMRYFIETVPGKGDVVRPCAAGTVFLEAKCDCGYGHVDLTPTTPVPELCLPSVYFPFNTDLLDKSSEDLTTGIMNVKLTNSGTAFFNGNSKMHLWRYANVEWGTTLVIKFRFRFDYTSKINKKYQDLERVGLYRNKVEFRNLTLEEKLPENIDRTGGTGKSVTVQVDKKSKYKSTLEVQPNKIGTVTKTFKVKQKTVTKTTKTTENSTEDRNASVYPKIETNLPIPDLMETVDVTHFLQNLKHFNVDKEALVQGQRNGRIDIKTLLRNLEIMTKNKVKHGPSVETPIGREIVEHRQSAHKAHPQNFTQNDTVPEHQTSRRDGKTAEREVNENKTDVTPAIVTPRLNKDGDKPIVSASEPKQYPMFLTSKEPNLQLTQPAVTGTQKWKTQLTPDMKEDIVEVFAGHRKRRKRQAKQSDYQALVANYHGRDQSQHPSIMIAANFADIRFSLKTYGHDRAAFLSLPVADDWNYVTMIYNGDMFTASVRNRKGFETTSIKMSGSIERRQSELIIGSCPGFSNFYGEIDDLMVYHCIPSPIKHLYESKNTN